MFLSLTQRTLQEQAAQAVYNNQGTGWKTEVRFPTCAEIHSSPLRHGLRYCPFSSPPSCYWVSGKRVVASLYVVLRLKMRGTKHIVSTPQFAFLERCNLFLLRSGMDGTVARATRPLSGRREIVVRFPTRVRDSFSQASRLALGTIQPI